MNRKCIEEGYIKEKTDNAVSGINVYKKIRRKYHIIRNIARTLVVIFPEKSEEFERYTLEEIENYLKKRSFRHFVLVGKAEFSKELTGLKCCAGYEIITEEEMQLLIGSFHLCMFATNAVVVSLDLPYGRKASNILSFDAITKEDIIKKGVFSYQKDSFKAARVMYVKSRILRFMEVTAKLFFMYLPPKALAGFLHKAFLERGREIYEGFLKDYSDCVMLPAPYSGTGDVYLAAMMLRKYVKSKGIEKYFIPVVGKSNARICSLFGFDAIPLSRYDMDSLIRFLSFSGISQCEAEILHHDPINLETGIMDKMRNVNGLDFFSMYMCGVFNTNNRDIVSLPEFDRNHAAIDKLFADNNLKKGKTVVLAPYNYTLPKMSKLFWERLADSLLKKGYTVCTNCCGKKEKAIKGTVPVFFPYSIIVPFLEQAGAVIAIRSGLCEVISSARCKKVILYLEGFKWNGRDNIDYFSLNGMGLCSDAEEFTYKDRKTQLSLVDKISGLFD